MFDISICKYIDVLVYHCTVNPQNYSRFKSHFEPFNGSSFLIILYNYLQGCFLIKGLFQVCNFTVFDGFSDEIKIVKSKNFNLFIFTLYSNA